MTLGRLSTRTYARYAVPLTLLSLVACAPLLAIALRLPAPANAAQARHAVKIAWALAGAGLVPVFWLVGGVTPAVRAVARGVRPSQLRILGAGLVGLARAFVPCTLAMLAIALGGLALVVPGIALVGLFALTGASTEPAPSMRLAESAAIVQRSARTVIGVLIATSLVFLGTIFALQSLLALPFPRNPVPADWATFRHAIRITAIAVAIAAPVPAVVLAAIHTRAAS